jgi:dihydroorotase
MALIVRSGRVIDPAQNMDQEADILIRDGMIVEIGRGLTAPKFVEFDARDKVVCPGFIDVHVHLREPGQEYKETIATGTRAAAAGGFAHVCCMPNTDPAIDDPSVVQMLHEKAKAAIGVKMHVFAAMTKANAGKELAEMGRLHDAGAALFSDDAFPSRTRR